MVLSLEADWNTMGDQACDMNSMHSGNDYNYAEVPIHALDKSRIELNKKLYAKKLLLSPQQLLRDYRGLCDLMGIKKFMPSGDDWISNLFQDWSNTRPLSECNVKTFLEYLELIDRYDVYDDIITLIEEDCRKYFDTPVPLPGRERGLPAEIPQTIEDCRSLQSGYGLVRFDVLLLYDEVADYVVAKAIYERLISNRYIVCNNANSFIPSGQFEYEQFENVINRCKNVFVLLSEAIQNNRLLSYLVRYSKATSIEKPDCKIVPILLEDLSGSDFDSSIMTLSKIKYFLHQSHGTMDVFWNSLVSTVNPCQYQPPAQEQAPLYCSTPPIGRTSPHHLPCRASPLLMLPHADNPPAYYSGDYHQAGSSSSQPLAETMQAGTSRDSVLSDIIQEENTSDIVPKKKSGTITKIKQTAKEYMKAIKKTSKREKKDRQAVMA